MDTTRAREELRFVDELTRRARAQIDPHAFHDVHWGLIVLVWYPLENWLQAHEHPTLQVSVRVAAILIGMLLSGYREMRLARSPRFAAEDVALTRQIIGVVYASIGVGTVLSALAPSFDLIADSNIPIVWGLVYANIAFVTGLVYRRGFLLGAALIFAGVIAAIVFQPYNGYILGPCMGLGMILPGLAAEREVSRARQQLEQSAA
jgi:hypothetical protein